MTIDIFDQDLVWVKEDNAFYASLKEFRFSPEYIIENPKTYQERVFKLSHSSGPEDDPLTDWIFKAVGHSGMKLILTNRAKFRLAQQRARK